MAACEWCEKPAPEGLSLCDRCFNAELARREQVGDARAWCSRARREMADLIRSEIHGAMHRRRTDWDEWREDDARQRQADMRAAKTGGGGL